MFYVTIQKDVATNLFSFYYSLSLFMCMYVSKLCTVLTGEQGTISTDVERNKDGERLRELLFLNRTSTK